MKEFAFGCDSFGYLLSAQDIRHALPFTIDTPQTQLLTQTFQAHKLPLVEWDEVVGPHAHHFQKLSGKVGIQYPPGTGLTLAALPEGAAVPWLSFFCVVAFVGLGLWGLWLAYRFENIVAMGLIFLAASTPLKVLNQLEDGSYSINALLIPLLLSFVFAFWALRDGRFKALVSGAFFGLTVLDRVPNILLAPGFMLLFWFSARKKKLELPWLLGMILFGVLPLLWFQHQVAGAWLASTYNAADTNSFQISALWPNLVTYLSFKSGTDCMGEIIAIGAVYLGLARSLRGQSWNGLTSKTLGLAALVLFGVPFLFFLVHPIAVGYYLTASNLGAMGMLAAGVVLLGSRTQASARHWVFIILCLALGFRHTLYALKQSEHIRQSSFEFRPRSVKFPAELLSENSWVWSEDLSGTFWYYAHKPAFKLRFGSLEARKTAYELARSRNEPQYLIEDSPGFEQLKPEFESWGGILEPRGEVLPGHSYYLIR